VARHLRFQIGDYRIVPKGGFQARFQRLALPSIQPGQSFQPVFPPRQNSCRF
jgi:hypothetical protein